MERIAIIGATGAIGKTLGSALSAADRPYIAIGRSKPGLETAFGGDPLAEMRTWNPNDPPSVRDALASASSAVYAVGVDYTRFDLHPELMRKTLEGAAAVGLERLLLVGTVYPYGKPRTTPVREDHPREPHTFKGQMRKRQEDLLLDADSRGVLRGTVLRLPDFYGPHAELSYAADIFRAAVKGGRAQVIGPIDTPHEYVFVPDVGPIVLRLIDHPRAYGRVWHYGGPGTITPRKFARRVFAAVGRTPRLFVAGKTALRFVGLFNPMMREIAEMQYLFETPVILEDSALRELLGDLPKTSYDDGIARTIASMQSGSTVTR